MTKLQPQFKGTVIKGRFIPSWPEQRDAYLHGLEGQVVTEIIGKYQGPKTNPQLAYFHGVICVLASEASGYTREEVKGLLKGKFLTKYIKSPTGEEVAWVPSLTDLRKDVMSQFIDECIILCARHWSLVIPAPEEVKVS